MSIAIVGARGNMGQRYASICRYLEIPWLGFDIDNIDTIYDFKDVLKTVLIASSTESHMQLIEDLKGLDRPMLVEKPITKDPQELERFLALKLPVKMVNQYAFLYDDSSSGETYYNYWNSGKDGIFDYINIIGLAESPPRLMKTSPLWKCQINGKVLSLADMDHAYCDMIWNWVKNPKPDLAYIEKAHRRVHEGFYVHS